DKGGMAQTFTKACPHCKAMADTASDRCRACGRAYRSMTQTQWVLGLLIGAVVLAVAIYLSVQRVEESEQQIEALGGFISLLNSLPL
ncbi:MAG: hypothetical protein M3346_09690, partial [Actinomycetota bacterium]|nr:hypothetical protein [Actinomycetota bacterium]